MNNERMIPYITFESTVAMMERTIRRLWVLAIILVLLLVGTNLAWMIYENSFETYTEATITQENTDGYNNYIGNDGDIINGQTDSNNP